MSEKKVSLIGKAGGIEGFERAETVGECKHGKWLYGTSCIRCDREHEEVIAKAKASARESMAAIPKEFWEGNDSIKAGDYVVHKRLNQGVMLVIDDPKPCNIFELQARYRVERFIHIDSCQLQDDYRVATDDERSKRIVLLADWRNAELRPESWPTILGECLKCNTPIFNTRDKHHCPAASPVVGMDLGQEGGDYTYYHPIIGAELFTQVVNLTCSHELAVKVINNTLSLDENFFEKNISQFDNKTVLIIKACPFCSGPPCVEVEQDKLWADQFPDDAPTYDAHVRCHECGARGSNTQLDFDNHDYYDKESTARSAIYKWNKRENTFGGEQARLFNLERDL